MEDQRKKTHMAVNLQSHHFCPVAGIVKEGESDVLHLVGFFMETVSGFVVYHECLPPPFCNTEGNISLATFMQLSYTVID